MGIVLGGLFDTFPEGGEDLSSKVWVGMVRLEYTGREGLGMGLVLTNERLNTKSLGTLSVSSVAVDLRYFF